MVNIEHWKKENIFYIQVFSVVTEADVFQVFREVYLNIHFDDHTNTISDCRNVSSIAIEENRMSELSNFIARQRRTSTAKSAVLITDDLMEDNLFQIYLNTITNVHNRRFRVRIFRENGDVMDKVLDWLKR